MSGSITAVYCDGGVIQKNPSPHGGTWAWVHVGNGAVIAEACGVIAPTRSMPLITNNYSEYVAAVRALQALPLGWVGHIFTDSQITLGRLANGWSTRGLPPELVQMGQNAMERLGGTFWHLLAGHPTRAELEAGQSARKGLPVSRYNVRCDEECSRVAAEFLAKLGKPGKEEADVRS